MRPTDLAKLETNQFQKRRVDGEMVLVITDLIGCTDVTCKNSRDGVLQVMKFQKKLLFVIDSKLMAPSICMTILMDKCLFVLRLQ